MAAAIHFGNYLLETPNGTILPKSYPLDQLMAMITSPGAADKLWRQATQGVRLEELVYDVDCILHHRISTITGQREYLVRWLGFSSIFDTWEPPSVLLTPNILSDYWGTAVNDLTLDSTSGAPTPRRLRQDVSSDIEPDSDSASDGDDEHPLPSIVASLRPVQSEAATHGPLRLRVQTHLPLRHRELGPLLPPVHPWPPACRRRHPPRGPPLR